MPEFLPVLPVAVPLAVAGLLLLVGKFVPARLPDLIAVLTALFVLAVAAAMAAAARHAPLVYWFGGWSPEHGVVIGVDFVAGEADALVGALVALLFAASFVFAWGYFEEVRAFFHVLMLIFLAGMEGFCLSHDIFNLFVWFEAMSVAAFALTAYHLEAPSLEGALNFAVTNSLGSFLMLSGIALLYGHAGTLDFGALAQRVRQAPHDPLIAGAFTMLASGLFIKAAVVPFHFWLDDAHAVAPSPVSVVFSGAMVPLGIFGVAKLYWEVFAPDPAIGTVMGALVLGMGAASALLGGLACLRQRHLKRLLAFSTISHVGTMLIGLATLDARGLGGMLTYMVGHSLVKGALFMIAGIILTRLGGIDELGLRGRGREIMPAGIAMAVAGLLLGGAPVGLLDEGVQAIDAGASQAGAHWVAFASAIGTACTGGAVLRAAGRIFLGWGKWPGEERHAPSEDAREASTRPLWVMMLPIALLLLIALVTAHGVTGMAARAAARFIAWDGGASLGRLSVASLAHAPAPSSYLPWMTIGIALLIAAHDLGRSKLPRRWLAATDSVLRPLFTTIDQLHNGLVGDYVLWLVVGLALFSLSFMVVGG